MSAASVQPILVKRCAHSRLYDTQSRATCQSSSSEDGQPRGLRSRSSTSKPAQTSQRLLWPECLRRVVDGASLPVLGVQAG